MIAYSSNPAKSMFVTEIRIGLFGMVVLEGG
jgi:hypothetical protein